MQRNDSPTPRFYHFQTELLPLSIKWREGRGVRFPRTHQPCLTAQSRVAFGGAHADAIGCADLRDCPKAVRQGRQPSPVRGVAASR